MAFRWLTFPHHLPRPSLPLAFRFFLTLRCRRLTYVGRALCLRYDLSIRATNGAGLTSSFNVVVAYDSTPPEVVYALTTLHSPFHSPFRSPFHSPFRSPFHNPFHSPFHSPFRSPFHSLFHS